MSLSLSHISCGVRELHDLSDFRSVPEIIAFIRHTHPVTEVEHEQGDRGEYQGLSGLGDPCIRPAFFVFSNISSSRRTASLCKYITDNNLGTVLSTDSATNPNSGNKIKVHVWQVNWEEMDKIEGIRITRNTSQYWEGYEYRNMPKSTESTEEEERDAA